MSALLKQMGLEPTYYPLLPFAYSEAEIRAALERPEAMAVLAEAYTERENLIRAAQEDPFGNEPPLPHWADAEALLRGNWQPGKCVWEHITGQGYQLRDNLGPADRTLAALFLILLGGNRSGKSRYAGWKTMRSAVENPGSNILCLAETFKTSIETQQEILWHYLPPEYKALNGKHSKDFYIKWGNFGFGKEGFLRLPNGSKFHFKTYQQDPGDCEGWKFGRFGEIVVGCWADENLRVNWLAMLLRRLRFQQANLLWSFTPINGMTPAIMEAVGEAGKVLESRPAELLGERVNVPELPSGHMPYVTEAALRRGRVVYFWSALNPFGDGERSFYEGVKEDCAGRSSEYTQRIAYGYTKATTGKPFPKFGPWNVMAPERFPWRGKDGRPWADFQVVDPAGGRNWFKLWARLYGGVFYIYREWPSEQEYGEWAIPDEASNGDNLAKMHKLGPAQNSVGLGYTSLKKLWRELESRGDDLVVDRYIDPRAGRNPHAAEHGGSCLVDDLAEDSTDEEGRTVPGLEFTPASGVSVELGMEKINELLDWDTKRPFDAVMNSPRLYVSSECRNLIGALSHWPGVMGGEKHPWKDPIDCLRYLAVSDLDNQGFAEEELWYE